MQDQNSNMVYVVSLGAGTPEWSTISWRDIVNKKRRYFHPVGKGWPKEPPNYLGIRYDGRLQAIHHVDSWKIVDSLDEDFPEVRRGKLESPHYIYQLGDPMRPDHEVKGGKIVQANRCSAMLDLLLTSRTISEARDLTQERVQSKSVAAFAKATL